MICLLFCQKNHRMFASWKFQLKTTIKKRSPKCLGDRFATLFILFVANEIVERVK